MIISVLQLCAVKIGLPDYTDGREKGRLFGREGGISGVANGVTYLMVGQSEGREGKIGQPD